MRTTRRWSPPVPTLSPDEVRALVVQRSHPAADQGTNTRSADTGYRVKVTYSRCAWCGERIPGLEPRRSTREPGRLLWVCGEDCPDNPGSETDTDGTDSHL